MNPELEKVKKEIEAQRSVLENEYSISKIGVFGSVAKGNATNKSDIDFLVEFKSPIGLFEFSGLKLFLEDVFKRKVDLATPRALKSLTRDEILRSVVYL